MDGIGYIHSKGVVHRDMKLDNVFLDENLNAKIADFGFCKKFTGEDTDLLRTRCGS